MDWTAIIQSFIASLPTLLTAIAGLWVVIHSKKEITNLKEHVNSKMDLLLVKNDAAANLAGEKRGRAEEKASHG